MEISKGFVLLLHARDQTELDLARDLLEGADVPFVVDTSDQFEMLEVLEGSSAAGQQCILVPRATLERAVAVLEEAWGPEALEGRDPRK